MPSSALAKEDNPMATDPLTERLILDHVYQHEAAQPDRIYLT